MASSNDFEKIWESYQEVFQMQYRLRDFKAIGVDGAVRVLSQTEFFSKQRTDAKPSDIQACLVMAEVRRRKSKRPNLGPSLIWLR